MIPTEPSVRATPVFGVLSAVAPFLGAVMTVVLAFFFRPGRDQALTFAALFFLITLASMTFGVLFAFKSLKRHEKYRGLAWTGLVLNVVPLLIYVFHAILP
jgi:hypothetical protein